MRHTLWPKEDLARVLELITYMREVCDSTLLIGKRAKDHSAKLFELSLLLNDIVVEGKHMVFLSTDAGGLGLSSKCFLCHKHRTPVEFSGFRPAHFSRSQDGSEKSCHLHQLDNKREKIMM